MREGEEVKGERWGGGGERERRGTYKELLANRPPFHPLLLPSLSFTFSFLFSDATPHLYKTSCPSVRPSVLQQVNPVLISNDEIRSF